MKQVANMRCSAQHLEKIFGLSNCMQAAMLAIGALGSRTPCPGDLVLTAGRDSRTRHPNTPSQEW